MPKKMIIVSGLKPLSRLGLEAGWIGPPPNDGSSAKSVILTPLMRWKTLIIDDGFDSWMTGDMPKPHGLGEGGR
jgi:hypothetical protein